MKLEDHLVVLEFASSRRRVALSLGRARDVRLSFETSSAPSHQILVVHFYSVLGSSSQLSPTSTMKLIIGWPVAPEHLGLLTTAKFTSLRS
jgi:hypothetical protein